MDVKPKRELRSGKIRKVENYNLGKSVSTNTSPFETKYGNWPE